MAEVVSVAVRQLVRGRLPWWVGKCSRLATAVEPPSMTQPPLGVQSMSMRWGPAGDSLGMKPNLPVGPPYMKALLPLPGTVDRLPLWCKSAVVEEVVVVLEHVC